MMIESRYMESIRLSYVGRNPAIILLAILAKFMVIICLAIDMVQYQYHKWPKPVYYSKVM